MPSRSRLAGGVVLLTAGAAIAVKLLTGASSFSPAAKPAPYQTPPTRLPTGILKPPGGRDLKSDASRVTMRFSPAATSGYHKPAPYQTPPNRMPPGIQPAGSHPQLGGSEAAPSGASPVTMHFSAAPAAPTVSASDSGYHKAAPYQTPPNRMPPGIQPAGSHPQLDNAGKESAASPVTMQFSASPTAVAASTTDSGYHKAAPYQTPAQQNATRNPADRLASAARQCWQGACCLACHHAGASSACGGL